VIVEWACGAYQISERRACGVYGFARSSIRYCSVRPPQAALRARLHELASVRVQYGYRRLHVLLRREGWQLNHKRVYRIYTEEGLALKRKRPQRHRSAVARIARPAAEGPDERWCMDFVSDALADGRRLRVLTILDTCTRECLCLRAGQRLQGKDVAAVLTRIGLQRGLPETITCDNGSEFTGRSMDRWAYRNGVKLDFTRPGKPTDNAHIEAFNGRLRQECLSQHWFLSLADVQRTLDEWLEDYNNHRPHSALDNRTPAEYRWGGAYEPDRRRLQILRT
jgi:putative transposase